MYEELKSMNLARYQTFMEKGGFPPLFGITKTSLF